ncbi:MAG: chorismate mutase [Actinomycetota bacterium]
MPPTIRALRGATTLDADTRDQVIERTGTLVQVMLDRNGLTADDLISIFFTATGDISSEFPAAAARAIGLNEVPLLCARELDIEGAVPRCIRVMMHAVTDLTPDRLRHVYLEGAQPLRTDLPR